MLKDWIVPTISAVGTLILASMDLAICILATPIYFSKQHLINLAAAIELVIITPFRLLMNFCTLGWSALREWRLPQLSHAHGYLCTETTFSRTLQALSKNEEPWAKKITFEMQNSSFFDKTRVLISILNCMCENNDKLEAVKFLIPILKEQVNQKNSAGQNALCFVRSVEMAKILVDAGANVEAVANNNISIVESIPSQWHIYSPLVFQIIKFLLSKIQDAGLKTKILENFISDSFSIFSTAINLRSLRPLGYEVADFLLENGVSLPQDQDHSHIFDYWKISQHLQSLSNYPHLLKLAFQCAGGRRLRLLGCVEEIKKIYKSDIKHFPRKWATMEVILSHNTSNDDDYENFLSFCHELDEHAIKEGQISFLKKMWSRSKDPSKAWNRCYKAIQHELTEITSMLLPLVSSKEEKEKLMFAAVDQNAKKTVRFFLDQGLGPNLSTYTVGSLLKSITEPFNEINTMLIESGIIVTDQFPLNPGAQTPHPYVIACVKLAAEISTRFFETIHATTTWSSDLSSLVTRYLIWSPEANQTPMPILLEPVAVEVEQDAVAPEADPLSLE